MSIADLKARAQQLFDTFNTRDSQALLACYAPNAQMYDCAQPQPLAGHDQIASHFRRSFAAIPDVRVHTNRLVAEGTIVVVEWTMQGTHRGPLMGIPPTGKAVEFHGASFLTFRQASIVESRIVWDLAGLLRQIGLLPSQR